MANQPRVAVHAFFRRQGKVLFQRVVDRLNGAVIWRAPGGGIDWRETAEQALRREVREDLGVELASFHHRATLEGFITWNGAEEHEVVFLFDATPVDWEKLDRNLATAREADGQPLDLRWMAPAELFAAGERFYPESLAEQVLGVRVSRHIRAVALCVFRRGDSVLAFEAYDSVKERRFRRFPGGGIEYGESAEVAVRREMREELDTEIEDLRLLGVVENLFEYEGQPGHEIVYLYEASFPDPSRYESLETFLLADDGGWSDVSWVPLNELEDPLAPLVPEEVVGLL